jgi:hypothetical protein
MRRNAWIELKPNGKSSGTAILILGNSCSRSQNVGIVRTSETAKRGRTVERAGIV